MDKEVRAVRWVCDKRDCECENVRYIIADTLYEDICDKCGRSCREPHLETVEDPENTHERRESGPSRD